MDRLACVDVPAFPLQLLLGRHPDWAGHPVAVVARDAPQGVVLWVNEEARAVRVLPGMRYAAGLSLTADLRAGEVNGDQTRRGVEGLTARLQDLTPRVEPAPGEAGVFWLDASGLERLHGSLEAWSGRVTAAIAERGFAARVVVGFTRFGTYALARATAAATPTLAVSVLATRDAERAAADRVPLDRLGIEPRFREALTRLGIRTVGQLLELPPGGLLERFGPDAHRLHRMAAGETWEPLRPAALAEPVEARVQLERPETDAARLAFLVKGLLHPLLEQLAERREALVELQLHLDLEGGTLPGGGTAARLETGDWRLETAGGEAEGRTTRVSSTVQPAAPTLDGAQILELALLRLDTARLPAGVEELAVRVVGVAATSEQLRLFAERTRRDLDAAERAFARIRAEFGVHAVTRARLREGHLPEASFTWEPLERACLPRPRAPKGTGSLVRRIHDRPLALPPRSRHEPDGWLVRGLESGPVVRCVGPFEISGGWWSGAGVHREYHFLETQRGELLWVFYDRRRRRWFLHGWVE